jgi:predicted transcriptional regulator
MLGLKDFILVKSRILLIIAHHIPTSEINIVSQWAVDKININRSIQSLPSRGMIQKNIETTTHSL